MPKSNLRHRLLSEFNLLHFQLILLAVTVCVDVVMRILHVPTNILATLVNTFVTGNVAICLILLSRPLFIGRKSPWNWIGYIPTLLCIGFIASAAAEIPTYLLFAHHSTTFFRSVLLDEPFGIVVTLIVGILYFAFDQSRSSLLARNSQLQSQVQLGLMERQTHQSDLQQAHDIQVHLLPRETPQIPGYQIACAWQPARSVSGDYFDVLVLSPDKLGLCIADVAGKGMAAALLMANLQASVKAFTQDGGSNRLSNRPPNCVPSSTLHSPITLRPAALSLCSMEFLTARAVSSNTRMPATACLCLFTPTAPSISSQRIAACSASSLIGLTVIARCSWYRGMCSC